MAPWPEQGTEPKAPDKTEKRELGEIIKTEFEDSSENRTEQKPAEEKEVLTLDEGQLKALLDEAITYKNPKDREGKSELFKELLQEAEADETENKGVLGSKLPRAYYNLPVRRRHSRHQGNVCVSTTRGGSLQNLHSIAMEGGRGSRNRRTLVSARQREGGSLPSNVNVDDQELDIICPNYTSRATLQVGKEDSPASETANSLTLFKLQNVPNGMDKMNTKEDELNSSNNFPATPICVGPVESGAMLYPPSPVQHVSVLSIPPPQIHVGPDEHRISDSSEHKKLNISRNRHRKVVMGQRSEALPVVFRPPDDEVELTREGLLGLPLTAYWNRYSSFTLLDLQEASSRTPFPNNSEGKTKPVDENGNALGCVKMDSNCLDRKKQRRVKTKNDRNTILSDDIEGFRGGADIDTLMEYIESPSNILDNNKNKTRTSQSSVTQKSNVKVRAKEEESRPIKRRTKEKFQRCTSLEEISKTKLEDLTEESSTERINGSSLSLAAKKQGTVDDAELGKKSNWADEVELEERASVIKKPKESRVDRASSETFQDSEFHVVTKKHRKKKRRTGSRSRMGSKQGYSRGFPVHGHALERDGASGLLYQYRHHSNQIDSQPRRKSASSVPPSDKSDSSDLDSVHSLPVSSTTTRTKVGQNSVSGGSTPQASYADIARTAGLNTNLDELPMSLSSKRDIATETVCDQTPTLIADEYPPLEVKSSELNTENIKKSAKDNNTVDSEVCPLKNIEKTVISESCVEETSHVRKSSVVSSTTKRPPVILLDEPHNSQVVSELTFGFEVNHQLLQCEEVCSRNTNTTSSVMASTATAPPNLVNDPHYYRWIQQYLNSTWEKTMDDYRAGRAHFYNGQ